MSGRGKRWRKWRGDVAPSAPVAEPGVRVQVDGDALRSVLVGLDRQLGRARHDGERESIERMKAGVAAQLAAIGDG